MKPIVAAQILKRVQCAQPKDTPTKPVFAGVAGPIFIQTHRMMAEYHVRAWV